MFLLKILRQVKNSSALFTLLKNKFKKHDEFLGIIELKNDQKMTKKKTKKSQDENM